MHKISVRLDDEEIQLRDALAHRHGIDGSGVMRQALRRWAREEGIAPAPHAEAKKK
jgi:hypothetical protein